MLIPVRPTVRERRSDVLGFTHMTDTLKAAVEQAKALPEVRLAEIAEIIRLLLDQELQMPVIRF